MVPFYQILVDTLVAGTLLLLAIYSPLLLKKRLPRWAEAAMVAIGLTVMGGVLYALKVGHWPFRG